jgi:YD repeat-containing protein
VTTHPDDQPLHGIGASAADDAPRPGRRSADAGGTLRPRRIPAPDWGRHPSPRDVQRYYLCSEEPSGDFVEVIIPVTDAGRRRYFATSDGERLTEVDEDYFLGRGEGNARSLLELDAREMAELQAELNFVRPVLGRDPLAEVAAEAAAKAAEATDASEPVVALEATDASGPAEEPDATLASEPVEPVEPAAPDIPDTAYAEWVAFAAEPVHVAAMPEVANATDDDDEAVEEHEHEQEHEHGDDDDDDELMIEESDVTMGTSVFEGFEPVASRQPVAAEPTAAAVPADAPAHAPAHTPAHAAAEATAHPAYSADPNCDGAMQVSLAKGIAFVAHRGQLDPMGAEYIDHPGRVAERFDPLTEPVSTAVAWLHEVLGGTVVTAREMLEAGVLPEIVELVQLLTRTTHDDDHEYYRRIRGNSVALRVKLAALDDDLAPWRIRRLDYDAQVRLIEQHRHARELLGA